MAMTQEKFQSVVRGALIAIGGALLAYFGHWATSSDFGPFTLAIGAVASALVNLGYKYLQVEAPPPPPPVDTTKPHCMKAPPGWVCSREPGHDGPCAAYPVPV